MAVITQWGGVKYSTNDTKSLEAIHKWFDAQLSDHVRHAILATGNN